MFRLIIVLVACAIGLGPQALYAREAHATLQAPVIAIDIALEPDATMIEHADALNARLRKAYQKGYALDSTHQPHVTVLQRYVRTKDLDKIYAVVGDMMLRKHVAAMKLEAFKVTYVIWNGIGVAAIQVRPTSKLLAAQRQLIDAIASYTVKTADAGAFSTTPEEPDINSSTLNYVTSFVPESTGKKYVPHVTVGVAPPAFLVKLVAEPFDAFTFSPAAVSIYQLGNFGTARKQLKTWKLQP
jgi:hypothetical protein